MLNVTHLTQMDLGDLKFACIILLGYYYWVELFSYVLGKAVKLEMHRYIGQMSYWSKKFTLSANY